MAKYVYPAVFTKEDTGYSVNFPDLEGTYTCGDDLEDSIEMAEDALALSLTNYEDMKKEIPVASSVDQIKTASGEFVSLIRCDTTRYRKLLNNKSVKKTLNIPEWLNEAALAAGVNFSQVLQDALKEQLGY